MGNIHGNPVDAYKGVHDANWIIEILGVEKQKLGFHIRQLLCSESEVLNKIHMKKSLQVCLLFQTQELLLNN